MPVLTEGAVEVATYRSYGKCLGTRQKMVKGFFLNGVDMYSVRMSVDKTLDFIAGIFIYTADTCLAWFYIAVVAAKLTSYLIF